MTVGALALAPLFLSGCGGGSGGIFGSDKPGTSANFTFSEASATNAILTPLTANKVATDDETDGIYTEFSKKNERFYIVANQTTNQTQRFVEFAVETDDPTDPTVGDEITITNATDSPYGASYGESSASSFKFWQANAGTARITAVKNGVVTVQISKMRVVQQNDGEAQGSFTINGTFTYDERNIVDVDKLSSGTSMRRQKISKTN